MPSRAAQPAPKARPSISSKPDRNRRRSDRGDSDRCQRPGVPRRQSWTLHRGGGARRRHLVPAPDNSYQMTTGTSVPSAEVSGLAAFLLERNPDLTRDDVRKVLTSSARRLGAKERDDDYG